MTDIDLDFGDRNKILSLIDHIPAAIVENDTVKKHNTGVYFQNIPYNPLTNMATLDYKTAEQRGYFKIDFLNVAIYKEIKNEQELIRLMNKTPDWNLLNQRHFCEKLIHIGNHFNSLVKMPEPIDSILKLAMFISLIRPAKKYLIGKPWNEISQHVWTAENNDLYAYKKSHAVSYAHLIVVHMNLISEQQNYEI